MSFIDINLGWPNYIQLAEKRVPEFRNNIIVLDGDVPQKQEYRSKRQVVTESGNFLFLPLVIEKDIFVLLKDHAAFARFQATYSRPAFNYDICFNNWPLEIERYGSDDFKHWYSQAETVLGDQNILFEFWLSEHHSEMDTFVEQFITLFNMLAERKDVDALPPIQPDRQDDGDEAESPTD